MVGSDLLFVQLLLVFETRTKPVYGIALYAVDFFAHGTVKVFDVGVDNVTKAHTVECLAVVGLFQLGFDLLQISQQKYFVIAIVE